MFLIKNDFKLKKYYFNFDLNISTRDHSPILSVTLINN